ncbi:MAG: EAL domain-containing protein [Desulfuromonadales bacterium]|nr:EAL domain-containing protein [Desulfuromonadales bacterium]
MRLFNSIRRKVRLCISVAFLGFTLASTFTFFSQRELKNHLEEIRDLDFHLATSSIELLGAVRQQNQLYEESFLFGLPDSAEEADAHAATVLVLLDKMAWLTGQNHRLHTYPIKPTADLKQRYLDYSLNASRIYPVLATGVNPVLYLGDIQRLNRTYVGLVEEMEKTRAFYGQAFEQDIDAILRLAGQKNSLLIGFYLTLLLLMTVVINWVAQRMLIHPLGEIKEAVRRFGRGEPPLPSLQKMDPEDEIGELGLAFLKMTEDLEQTTVSKAYVDSILKNMSDALVVVDTEFRIRKINKATLKLSDYCEKELIGRHLQDLLEDFRDRDATPLIGKELRAAFVCRNLETNLRTREGEDVPVLLSTSIFYGVNNEIQGLVYVAKDITERKKATEEQKRQHEFLLNVFESISHPFYVINVEDYTISLFNNAANEEGMHAGITCHRLSHGLDHPCDGADHLCPLKEVVRTGKPVKVEHKHGARIVEVHGHPIFDENSKVTQMIEYSIDITTRKEAEKTLAHLAQNDFLTGLCNRLSFQQQLQQILISAGEEKRRVGLMFVDLDRFKIVNDSLGHAFGDQLLQTIARRITGCMRDNDLVARLGGDEFAIILPRVGPPRDMAHLAERLLETLAAPFHCEEQEIFTSASIGIAIYPENGDSVEEILKNADVAMYKAKQAGGNAFRFFSAGLTHQTLNRLHLETSLRNAVSRNEYLLHFQPQLALRTGKITGREALLRWQPLGGSLVPPDRFISILEDTGAIIKVGEWVLREACLQNKYWQENGYPASRIAVNISTRQVKQKDFVQLVAAILRETRLDPPFLELELTESIFLENIEENISVLKRLKDLGVTLAIDDFGTGYSCLTYLKSFPVDRIKIDRAFIEPIGTEPSGSELARSIIDMAHSLNLQVIAEGIETATQHDLLCRFGCDEGQGFYFSKALPASEILPDLRLTGPALRLVTP